MDRAELRALQAPVREKYQADPSTAWTPIRGEGAWADAGITTSVPTWSEPVRAGLHPATGGDGSDACSGDMLMQALVGCAGVTMRSVATAMGLDLGEVSDRRGEPLRRARHARRRPQRRRRHRTGHHHRDRRRRPRRHHPPAPRDVDRALLRRGPEPQARPDRGRRHPRELISRQPSALLPGCTDLPAGFRAGGQGSGSAGRGAGAGLGGDRHAGAGDPGQERRVRDRGAAAR